MRISVRVQFPEGRDYNWETALKEFELVGAVELAFFLPQPFLENVQVEEVTAPFKKLRLTCGSIHMAHAPIDKPIVFEPVLKKTIDIARTLDCNLIVVHPSFAKLENVESFIDGKVSPLLEEHNLQLCWETFSGKRRFLSGMVGIANFCHGRRNHKMCLDFSHIHDDQSIILENVDKYFSLLRVIHISNRIARQNLQHLPIFHKGADLDFHQILDFLRAKNFSGNLVLEYLPGYHGLIKNDAQVLIQKYGARN